jgi:hypothetical protein
LRDGLIQVILKHFKILRAALDNMYQEFGQLVEIEGPHIIRVVSHRLENAFDQCCLMVSHLIETVENSQKSRGVHELSIFHDDLRRHLQKSVNMERFLGQVVVLGQFLEPLDTVHAEIDFGCHCVLFFSVHLLQELAVLVYVQLHFLSVAL